MADNADILKYQVDVADAMKALEDLLRKFKELDNRSQNQAQPTTPLTPDVPTEEIKQGSEALMDFDRKGEKVVKNVLGQINPALASMADFAIDAAEGITKISPALLGVAGLGAAIGGLIAMAREMAAAWKDARDQAVEYEKRILALRESASSLQASIGDKLQKLGIFGAAEGVASNANALMQQGVPRDIAEFGSIAQQMGGLSDEQRARVMAGFAAGGKKAELTGNMAADATTLRQLEAAGATPQASGIMARIVQDMGMQARREALPANAFGVDETMRTIAAEIAKKDGLNEADAQALSRIARFGLQSEGQYGERVPGGTVTFGELEGRAATLNERARAERDNRVELPPQQIFIGTQMNGAGNAYLNSGFSSQMAGPTPSFGGR